MESKLQTTNDKAQKLFFLEAVRQVIAQFPQRSREIIESRYGIDGNKSLTLEEIGKKYSITRERVRQVIREVLRKVKEQNETPVLKEVNDKIKFTISENSGIMEEENLLNALAGTNEKEKGAIKFLLDCLEEIKEVEEKDEMKRSYFFGDFSVEKYNKTIDEAISVLTSEKNPLDSEDLHKKVSQKIDVDFKTFFNFLGSSEKIKKNNFEKWGLSQWKEITPKGTREKAFLVLKEAGKPLHFKEIAKLIDKHNLNKKKTHPQTVHNELIKDKKFVLVGRGIYALSQWGYKKGTVKDVIEEILQKSAKPLTKEEILAKVLEIRQVKKSTIIINLNNFFSKTKEGYTLKLKK